MPVTVYMQRDPRHDHSFGRPDPELTIALGVPNACNRCHADHDAAWAAEHVRDWYPDDAVRAQRRAVAIAIAQGRRGDPDSVPALLALLGGPGRHRPSRQRRTPPGALPDQLRRHTRPPRRVRDPAPLVRTGAAWSLAQRPSLAPDARDAMVAALDDPGAHGPAARRRRAARRRPEHCFPSRPPRRSPAPPPSGAPARPSAPTPPRRTTTWPSSSPPRAASDEAEREYRAALRLWPRSIQARHNLAMLLAQQGRPEEAATELETLLANDPVPASAFALGLLYGQMGRWNDAAAALGRCLAEDPTYPRARYNRALALAKAGETTAALDELERAADDPAARAEAVRTLVDLSRQVNDKARLERWVLEAARLDHEAAGRPGGARAARALTGGQDAPSAGGVARPGIHRGTWRRYAS